jgi:hypothetical protein
MSCSGRCERIRLARPVKYLARPVKSLLACCCWSRRSSPGPPALRATPLTAPIRLDGRLDEPAWRTADSITGLTQVEPHEGAPTAGRTVIQVLVNEHELVIGVRADDPEPGAITAYSRQRDADLDSEDHVRSCSTPSSTGAPDTSSR